MSEQAPSAAESEQAYRLCIELEKLPASEQQTKCSLLASKLHSKLLARRIAEHGEQQEWRVRKNGVGKWELLRDSDSRFTEIYSKLLSAQAAIEKQPHDIKCHLSRIGERPFGEQRRKEWDAKGCNCWKSKIDLFLLHQHDAEVRKSLVEALEHCREFAEAWGEDDLLAQIVTALAQCKDTNFHATE